MREIGQGLYKRSGASADAAHGASTGTLRGVAAMMTVALLAAVLGIGGCGQADTGVDGGFGTNPITAESLEGLILEGEGPIPARLIYRSRNTISSEEDRLVLDAIAQELDKLVELAGRLDDAMNDDTMMGETMY